MIFRYQSDFDALDAKCPPPEYGYYQNTAYRFISEDIKDSQNFTSQYHKKPKRFIKSDDSEKCKSMALSLFLTEEKAKARFKALKKGIGSKIYQIIGTHLAAGELAEEHGVQSHVEKNGHFSLHIVEKIDYSEYFKLVDRL